ncbi:MAG: peptidase M23 [Halobacteriovorax sp.]|mgnify:CR=1 FL=1|nr:peptidase M23 [Halobacteriovorax sp.]
MKFVILFFLVTSCSMISTQTAKTPAKIKQEKVVIKPKDFSIRPGEAITIDFPVSSESTDSVLKCDDQKIPFFKKDDKYLAFVAETYFSNQKPMTCVISKNGVEKKVANISVSDKTFPSEKLNVDQRRVSLNPKDLKRVQKEQVFLNKNYASSPSHPYFEEPFMLPIDAYVTSIYGSRRLFNNSKQSQHLGTDFRAAVGEPIYAANAGKVVVARDLFFTGGTVTIDHGLGIFTIYGHLSKVEVNEGDYIPKGVRLGLAGATGRVTGPHLHWGVKVNGHFIEGESLVKASEMVGDKN